MVIRWTITWLISVVLSGCGYHILSKVPDQLDATSSQIVTGQTSRKEVRSQLGEAFISDDRVEVYRVMSGYDVLLPAFIIPFAWDSEEVIIYAMATYDENDRVEEIDWDVYQLDRELYPEQDFGYARTANLHAGEFHFVAFATRHPFGSKREEILLATISASQNALRKPPSPGMCAVIFFVGEMDNLRVPGELYLDGEFKVEAPVIDRVYRYGKLLEYWDLEYVRTFTRSLVAEGEHELRLTTWLKPHEFRRKFQCKAGKTYYAFPHLTLVESEPWGIWRKKIQYDGEIKIDSQPPESYERWRQLLFYRGEWLSED